MSDTNKPVWINRAEILAIIDTAYRHGKHGNVIANEKLKKLYSNEHNVHHTDSNK